MSLEYMYQLHNNIVESDVKHHKPCSNQIYAQVIYYQLLYFTWVKKIKIVCQRAMSLEEAECSCEHTH